MDCQQLVEAALLPQTPTNEPGYKVLSSCRMQTQCPKKKTQYRVFQVSGENQNINVIPAWHVFMCELHAKGWIPS